MKLISVIEQAYHEKWALGGFNIYNLESAQAVSKAANEHKKPALMMMSEKSLKYAGFEQLISIAKSIKQNSEAPLYLHLDHGSDIKIVRQCLKAKFDSVMFDGSKLPLEQNIMISKELAKQARRHGIAFEAEIGRIGGKEDYVESQNFKTDPAEAVRFFKEVKPDMLAVAIGNVHGEDIVHEELDFTLLAKIADVVRGPLVLHGCSNRQPQEYKVAISTGVVKINIDTETRQSFVEGLKKGIGKKIHDPREILGLAREEMTKTVSNKIEIFSCSTLKCSR